MMTCHLLTRFVAGAAAALLAIAPAASFSAPPPQVVSVSPPDGASDVDPVTEIRIRFDRAMLPSRGSLQWEHDCEGGFRLRGSMRYLDETNEFVLPVRLTPGCSHKLRINEEYPFKEGEYQGFSSVDQVGAKPHSWSFTTAGVRAASDGRRPKVEAVDPPSETEIALLTPLKVKFDRPMDPNWYGLAVADVSRDRMPKVSHFVKYDPKRYEFTLPLSMPPNWNGEIQLVHFYGEDGWAAEPVTLKYHTFRQPISESLRGRIEGLGKSPELVAILERIRAASREVTSVSEEVRSFIFWDGRPAWLTGFEMWGDVLKMQGQRQFLASIDQHMRFPFRIGSDGTRCWFRYRDEILAYPFEEFGAKQVEFCNPFGVASASDVKTVIRRELLEYLGEVVVDGRRLHKIRSWDVRPGETRRRREAVRDWYVDPQTLSLARVEQNGVLRAEYRYARINQPIPDEEFQPETGPGIGLLDPKSLGQGDRLRSLTVNDGTAGVMRVQWGAKGPKGSSNPGLKNSW